VTIDPAQSFRVLRDRVAAAWTEALEHRACPFEAVVEAVNPPRDPSRNPIFDVMLMLQNQPTADLHLPGLTARRVTLPARVAKVDLALCLEDGGDGVAGRLEYATDLFDPGRIERMAMQIERLALSALADPETPLAMLSLLSDAEYRRVTADFNATDRDYPSDTTIVDLFAVQAEADPTAVALIAPDGTHLDYGALRDRAEALAHRLMEAGIGQGDVVGLCLERSAAMMVSLLVGKLQTLADSTSSPAEILNGLNRGLHARSRGGFTTCLILRADPDGNLTIANAGHLFPYKNGAEMSIENGLPLGLSENETYTETYSRLDESEQLTLVTDGVVEARGKDGEIFGFARTQAISNLPAEAIAQTAQDFGQDDDISVIAITRKGRLELANA